MTHIEWNAKHLVCIILPLFILMQTLGMCEFARKVHIKAIMKTHIPCRMCTIVYL